jgi:tetratricopeptide (TPR) repeat protein
VSPWLKRRLGQRARRTLKAVGFLLLVFACLLGIQEFTSDPPGFVATAIKAVAFLTGIATLLGFAFALLEGTGPASPPPPDPSARRLDEAQPMVDRDVEVAELAGRIEQSHVVNCHGDRGAGKSFLLRYLSDVINGHRRPNPEHAWPKGMSAALYFDVADASGFKGVESQVCWEAFGADGTWSQFIAYVQREFGDRQVLLILDNVNSPSLWLPVGRAVSEYLLTREHDCLVLGSIGRLEFDNREVPGVEMEGLDLESFERLAELEDSQLEGKELIDLYEEWDGFPYYAARGARHAALAERTQLAPGTRQLAAYAALLALLTREIRLSELGRCPVADFNGHLEDAIRQKLVDPTVDGLSLRMHDIARDDTLRLLPDEVRIAAGILFERKRAQGEGSNAAIFAMHADPREIEGLDEVLESAIRAAVKSRDYAFMESLYEFSRHNERLLEFLARAQDRYDLFAFSRASQLAGLGAYQAAELELAETSIGMLRDRDPEERTILQLEMQYLQADLAHLLNRYDEAALGFEQLANVAAANGHMQLSAKCVGAQAHVLRHQGRELDRAMELYEQAERLGKSSHELTVEVRAITGASGLKVFRGLVPENEEARLDRIECQMATSGTQDGHMLGIWKAQARVDWLRGRQDKAKGRIEDAIRKAEALNDRLLYNLFFERAEFLRLGGDGIGSIEDYGRALSFGTGNGDRNLAANARLGLVLADLSTGRWVHHRSKLEARGVAMDARERALEADIQVTAQIAERIVARLDGGVGELPTRLIVF